MSMGFELQAEQRKLRNDLQDIVSAQSELTATPLALAAALHAADISPTTKRDGIAYIRGWVDYTSQHEVPYDNPFAVRYHVSQFAAQELGEQHGYQELQEIDLAHITSGSHSYTDILSRHTSLDILSDPDIAIVGGAARLALKIHAGVAIGAEVPISDIDAVITSKAADIAAKAATYGIDLSGAKIVDGNVRSALDGLATNFDCTMNQAAVHNGKLLFSEQALQDVKEGNIRLIAKNDPLFGSEGIVLEDGNVYINRVGFYRGLSFLLRGKGDRLIVSQENIEREKDNIGRYWQVMLFVKLLPMKDESARYRAIGQWHELAQRIGSTQTSNAADFLQELTEAYPSTNAGKARTFSADAQARWIVGRLVGEAVKHLYQKEDFIPPTTYTEANLALSQTFADYDYDEFMSAAVPSR